MAVTKRLRYEVLRRDNHACRYCGGVAPDAILTVDHVVPVALGGSDDPSNLVAACKDCNAGKSATPVGAELVVDVAQDAIRWANAMRVVTERAQQEREARYEQAQAVCNYWESRAQKWVRMADDWEWSVAKFGSLGLTTADMLEAADRAITVFGVESRNRWRYFCGICWETIRQRQDQAAALLAPEEPSEPAAESHCAGPWCVAHHPTESDPGLCGECGRPGCEWNCGYLEGRFEEEHEIRERSFALMQATCLSAVVDGPVLAGLAED